MTTPSRRTLLRTGAVAGVLTSLGAAAVARLPSSSAAAALATSTGCATLTPEETEGPYWVDERLRRSDLRADSGTGAVQGGTPLTLTLRLQDAGASCAPQAGAYVDVWHCNAQGLYSDESANGTVGVDWLRGYQVSDADGVVTFTTVYPGFYSGRTVHVHVRIRTSLDAAAVDFTTQIFFDEATNSAVLAQSAYQHSGTRTTNATDGIYDAANLVTPTGSATTGYAATFVASLDFGDGTTSDDDSDDQRVRARVVAARVVKRGRRRVVEVRLRAHERVTGRLRLLRHDDVLVQRRWGWLRAGTHTLRVPVPASVPAGPAKVQVVLADETGHSRSARKRVVVPQG